MVAWRESGRRYRETGRMKNAMHHIHRKVANHTNAWVVLIQRHNLDVFRSFSDNQHGGKRKALEAARSYRDGLMEPLTQYVYEMGRRSVMRRNNRSGIVGVGRYVRKDLPKGAAGSVYWMARWIDENGRQRAKKFATSRWGERGAKQLAVEVRERELRRAVALKNGVSADGDPAVEPILEAAGNRLKRKTKR
jgi:hypothetical protein